MGTGDQIDATALGWVASNARLGLHDAEVLLHHRPLFLGAALTAVDVVAAGASAVAA